MSDSKKRSQLANYALCFVLFAGIFFYVTNSEDPYSYYQEDNGVDAEVWIGPGLYYGVWFGSEWEYNNWCYAHGYSHHGHRRHGGHHGGRHHGGGHHGGHHRGGSHHGGHHGGRHHR